MYAPLTEVKVSPKGAERYWIHLPRDPWQQYAFQSEPLFGSIVPDQDFTVLSRTEFRTSLEESATVIRRQIPPKMKGSVAVQNYNLLQSGTTQDLMEVVKLRFENSLLRRENENLKGQLRARAFQVAEQIQEPVRRVSGFSLPSTLGLVAERLERSRAMLGLDFDWDGEGSPGYKEPTWQLAAELVVKTATGYYQSKQKPAPAAVITKGDEGSIDVQWRTPTRNILINVPADLSDDVHYFAHDAGAPGHSFGAKLNPRVSNEWLLTWLLA